MLFFVGAYNSLMKLFFVALAAYPVYLCHYSKSHLASYESALDTFPATHALAVCAGLSVLIHPALNAVDLAWSFAVWLEVAAVLPQITLCERLTEQREGLRIWTALWTASRWLYVCSFLYRFLYEGLAVNKIAMVGCMGQAAIGVKLMMVLLSKRESGHKKTE